MQDRQKVSFGFTVTAIRARRTCGLPSAGGNQPCGGSSEIDPPSRAGRMAAKVASSAILGCIWLARIRTDVVRSAACGSLASVRACWLLSPAWTLHAAIGASVAAHRDAPSGTPPASFVEASITPSMAGWSSDRTESARTSEPWSQVAVGVY